MTIIALDLATKTGYCVIRDGEIIDSGIWDLSRADGEHYGHMFNKLMRHLVSTDNQLPMLDYIAYELAHHRAGPATRIGVGLNGTVLAFCAETGTSMKEVHTGTLKKWATGDGKAKKPEMQQAAKKFLGRHPEDDNEGDAVLIAKWCEEQVANEPAF